MNEFKLEEVKKFSEIYYATDLTGDLSFTDVRECLSSFAEGNGGKAKMPDVYVYKSDGPVKITPADIIDIYEERTDFDFGVEFPVTEMAAAIENLNDVLAELPKPYICIGKIRDVGLNDIWKTIITKE